MSDQPEAMLIVERGIRDVSVIPLDQSVSVLGKPPSAYISIDSPYVSRRHAQIVRQGGRFEILDLGSKNGTCVNGMSLEGERHRLQNGDRIELAHGQVVLRFQQWGSTVTLSSSHRVHVGDVVVDIKSREVWVQGSKLEPPLTRKEFDILGLLYERNGEACSKDEIAARGWPERTGGDIADQDIEQCIRRLRLRIESDPSQPLYIVTLRGFGYKFSRL